MGKKRKTALEKELAAAQSAEKKLANAAMKARPALWKQEVEKRIPVKVYTGLESAFCKGFAFVFDKGRVVIERGYDKDALQADHAVRDFAVRVKGTRKELKQMRRSAGTADLKNLTVTTIEGLGLGALGVGMPDIVLFLGTLLKGVYETALNFGFDYESRQEQLLILAMMETALSTGEDWAVNNARVEELMLSAPAEVTEEAFTRQQGETASAFAVDMLLLKFIQGLPVVGIIGGAANPVYYRKIMKYVQLKYRKRYLLKLMRETE